MKRETVKRFKAIKKYIANLRLCVLNDFIDGVKESLEIEILNCINYLLKKEYPEFVEPLCVRKSLIDFNNKETLSQINQLFKAILAIENDIYGTVKNTQSPKAISKPKQATNVLQYDKQGNFIATYPSSTQAFKATGISQKNISKVLAGRGKSAGNFVWKYATTK